MNYLSVYFEGFYAFDSVCIVDDPEACIQDFEWFAVVYSEGTDGIHGIVGMSTGLTDDSGPLLVENLYEGKVISEPVFGWYLTGLANESYLDIGILSEESIREGEQLVWLPVLGDYNMRYWWTNVITGVKINEKAYSLPSAYAMTDTGTSCIYTPTSVFSRLIAHVS